MRHMRTTQQLQRAVLKRRLRNDGNAQETFIKSVLSLRNEFSGLYFRDEELFLEMKGADVVVVQGSQLTFGGSPEDANQIVARAKTLEPLYRDAVNEVVSNAKDDEILELSTILKPVDRAAGKVNRMLSPLENDFRL